jgi:hypothetical protein
MACYHPMNAVRMKDGSVKFTSPWSKGAYSDLVLPCGQCIGCRLERSRQWAMRCLHESSLHEFNSFVTFTYSDSSLPSDGSLNYSHFQLFMKRLRKKFGKVSFYCGGEYGETTRRPHYHAILFGIDFPDKVYYSKSYSGDKLYTSSSLDSIWGLGACYVGSVTFASAAYIARYCVAKVNGALASKHYEVMDADGVVTSLLPEFNHMSLKPAIGKRWLERYMTDVYPRDFVVVNGAKMRPPKYYDSIFTKLDVGEFSEIVSQREMDAYGYRSESTDSRLYAREQVHLARSNMLLRSI